MIDTTTLWTVILGLGFGSFALRFVFLGFIGNRALPAWLLRHLRYTAVAVLPALIAPLILWPAANGGQPEPTRLVAAAVTFGVGYFTKNVIAAMVSGALVLIAGGYLLN
ncbi:AzlD domain-containing protein [Puniceibacterium sediminis]|uniref:Branched-chain amino acid transport protein n=1 Tax=Puniceibacterium sediminis TaxID=1608407 RepID=A0A238VJH8_9RHOB|nr:AzlD domain-containing protein [Puniceibacterium sediminis]SNR34525.1 Branched-chain amino acid transport protein [Puniceibacterium sediminis]